MFRHGLIAIAVTLVAVASLAPRARADSVSDFITKWDSNHDGTLDLAEITKAADAEFDTLDVNHDGTLDRKELGNRVTEAELAAADKDHDGTLNKAEYESIAATRLKAANPDGDTTIEAAELRTAAGGHLLQLLQ